MPKTPEQKAAKKAYMREWCAKNVGKRRESAAKYRASPGYKERQKKYYQNYYESNKDAILAKTALAYEHHKRRIRFAKDLLGGRCSNEQCVLIDPTDYRVLQFDHYIGEKKYNLSLQSLSDRLFWEECCKVRLLCAACHHLHTHYNAVD